MFILGTDACFAQLKDMLRILTDEEDALLRSYLITAESFVQGAVGKNVDGFYSRKDILPMYQTACFALVGTYYTYRISESDGNVYPVNDTANALIGQMRAKYTLALRSSSHG